MSTEFEFREIPAQSIVYATATCTHAQIGPTLARLLPSVGKNIQEHGGTFVGPPFARWTRWGATDCDVEGGIAVAFPIAVSDDIQSGTLWGGTVAFYLHIGPYDQLPPVYAAMSEWVTAQGKTASGAPWDSYINDPMDLPPSEWRTELFLPVE